MITQSTSYLDDSSYRGWVLCCQTRVASPAITAWLLGESVETQLALISPHSALCPRPQLCDCDLSAPATSKLVLQYH